MKIIIRTTCILIMSFQMHAQDKKCGSDSCDFRFNIDMGLAGRNVWRGLDYGSSPSLWGDLSGTYKNFSLGAVGTTTLNGSKTQFGTWLELYASYEIKNFSFIIDDYFFFNAEDQENDYFEYRPQYTQHLIEGRIEYENNHLKALVGYVIYSNQEDNTNGVYIEATYKLNDNISFTAGGITGEQWLSFYDAGGITTLGINGHRKVHFLKYDLNLNASLIFNPNYKNASPFVGNNPVYFVMSAEI